MQEEVIEIIICPTSTCLESLSVHEADDEIIVCPRCNKKYKTWSSGGDSDFDFDYIISLKEIEND